MNRKDFCFYPILLYIILLFGVWVLSWFAGVVDLLIDNGERVHSLVSAEGLRWAFRNAVPSLSYAPWAVTLFCVLSFGLVKSSELLHTVVTVFSAKKLSANRRVAGYMTLITFLCCLFLLFMATVAPWRVLMGVIPSFMMSPLAKGWPLLLLFVSIMLSVVHGFAFGVYRSVFDLLKGVSAVFSSFVPAFMAMLPASAILSCLEFTGFLIDEKCLYLLSIILYVLPFVPCFLVCITKKDSSR